MDMPQDRSGASADHLKGFFPCFTGDNVERERRRAAMSGGPSA
jgi:hypothetical protein